MKVSIPFVMNPSFSEQHFQSSPFEGDVLPHNMPYAQHVPPSTLRYREQNCPFPTSAYSPCMRNLWSSNGSNLNIPTASAHIEIEPITGWVRDNASPVGAENTPSNAWLDSESMGLDGYQQGRCPSPMGELSNEATCGGSPIDGRTSLSRLSTPNAK